MDKIHIETEIEQFYSVILILKPRSWNANGDIDIETATVEYDFYYRTSNGFLKTSIAHPWLGRMSRSPHHSDPVFTRAFKILTCP